VSLEAELSPLLSAVGRELIAATPESWASAQLSLVIAPTTATTEAVSHAITSPEGLRDLVVPTEDLMRATACLVQACRAVGRPFRELLFTVRSDARGAWRFQSEWIYDAQPLAAADGFAAR
jgi:hypothetical protein